MISSKVSIAKWKTPSVLRFALSGGLCFLVSTVCLAETFRSDATVPEFIPSSSTTQPYFQEASRAIPSTLPTPKNTQILSTQNSETPPSNSTTAVSSTELSRKHPAFLKTNQRILPLITFYNAVEGDVFNWWAENKSIPMPAMQPPPFASSNATVDSSLNGNLQMWRLSKKIMSELIQTKELPWSYGVSNSAIKNFPNELKKTALSKDEMRQLAKAVGASVIVAGEVTFTKSPIIDSGYRIRVRLQALRQDSGVQLGEILRISDVHPWEFEHMLFAHSDGLTLESFSELHTQMLQKKNDVKPQYVRLLVSGNLNYDQLELLKQKIQKSIKGVRALRSESMENEQVALLVDFDGAGAPALGQSLSKVKMGSFLTQVVSTDSNQVLFDVLWRGR